MLSFHKKQPQALGEQAIYRSKRRFQRHLASLEPRRGAAITCGTESSQHVDTSLSGSPGAESELAIAELEQLGSS